MVGGLILDGAWWMFDPDGGWWMLGSWMVNDGRFHPGWWVMDALILGALYGGWFVQDGAWWRV